MSSGPGPTSRVTPCRGRLGAGSVVGGTGSGGAVRRAPRSAPPARRELAPDDERSCEHADERERAQRRPRSGRVGRAPAGDPRDGERPRGAACTGARTTRRRPRRARSSDRACREPTPLRLPPRRRWIARPSATSAASFSPSASVGCGATPSATVSIVDSASSATTASPIRSVACGPTITTPSSSPYVDSWIVFTQPVVVPGHDGARDRRPTARGRRRRRPRGARAPAPR